MTAPVRTCVGCRAREPVTEMLRVIARNGVLVPDPGRRLPGRGAHLHRDLACLAQAQRRRAFPRALRVAGPLDDTDLTDYLRDSSVGREREA